MSRPGSGARDDGRAPGDPPRLTDGGRRSLFAATPHPVVEYELVEGGEGDDDGDAPASPVVRRVNPAFEETFDVEDGAGAPLSAVLVEGEPVDDGAPGGDLLRFARDGEATAVERRCDTVAGERLFLVRVVPVEGGGYVVYVDASGMSAFAGRGLSLVDVVTHDLRNPLEVAKIRLDAARETGEAEHFEEVAAAHERMDRIIEDALSLARRGRTIDEREPTDVASVARDAWRTVASGSATLAVDDPGTVSADADRLRAAFENLFRNAIEHGRADATVTVGALPDGFYVADDGPGIPEPEREQVFEPGYTTADEGSGFGLAIVAAIVEAHGWDVAVTDGADGGARFEVTGVERPD